MLFTVLWWVFIWAFASAFRYTWAFKYREVRNISSAMSTVLGSIVMNGDEIIDVTDADGTE